MFLEAFGVWFLGDEGVVEGLIASRWTYVGQISRRALRKDQQ